MKILLTNDDGIHAPGLCALFEALAPRHTLFVVAPDGERSAVGHAITLSDPLRVREVRRKRPAGGSERFGWAVSGTPADCVKLALLELLETPVDLVVSGINQGANTGINVLYSGTVSAATEAAILGVKAVALSLDSPCVPDFCLASLVAERIVDWAAKTHFPQGTAINVNIPAIPLQHIKGVRLTRQGTGRHQERFEKRKDPRGNVYYWQTGSVSSAMEDPSIDRCALAQGYITVTPIHADLTDYQILGRSTIAGIESIDIWGP
ncbi:MAG: 5'/3'-nucleotidase SurE [Deltaproteobacteria bacterium]